MTRINLRKISPTKRYTVRELANKLDVTTRAIYLKLKDGLPSFPMKKKLHILGEEFIEYEKSKRVKRKQYIKESEFWCCSCKNKIEPLNKEVQIEDFSQTNKKVHKDTILLTSICPVCKNQMFKFSNTSKIEEIKSIFKTME